MPPKKPIKARRRARGLSLLEVLLGVVIFGIAMLPVLSLSQSSAKETYSMAKHIIASQVANSIMDRLIAIPFSEITKYEKSTVPLQESGSSPGGDNLLDHQTFQEMIEGFPADTSSVKKTEILMPMKDGISKAFKTFTYSVKLTKSTYSQEQDQMILVEVTVSWNLEDSGKGSKKELTRWCVKYNDGK